MTASLARKAARTVVSEVRERDAWAHEVLHAVISRSELAARDRAFATRLAYGTIATRGTCDEIVAERLTPGTALQPQVSDCLALSVHEIIFMSTEARAAVHEGVELVRSVQPRAAGLANAVLRRVARDAETFPWGDSLVDDEALARQHGHPVWLTRMWIEELGRETATSILPADNEPAPLFLAPLAADPLESVVATLAGHGVVTTQCPVPNCLIASDPVQAISAPAVRERSVRIIDAAAQFAAGVVPLSPGALIVEIGAGRGGKSLSIAARARRESISIDLLALDTHADKLAALEQDATRYGLGSVRTRVVDATDPEADGLPSPGTADAVLVDAPCSGLGTLRRRPDRRWRATAAEIPALAALGSRLLASASRLVKPGGFVVYSTCTITREENSGVVEGFLGTSEGAAFVLDTLTAEVPEEWSGFLAPEGWFQSLPREGGPDGHFVARLKRVNG